MLALEGTRLSSITIQKILNENSLGTRVDRWLALEKANAEKVIEITPEQAAFLEKLNPCFRERHVESGAPGELLSADTFFVGNLKGIGKVSGEDQHPDCDAENGPSLDVSIGPLELGEDAQAFFGILDGQLKAEGDELVAGDDVAAIAQQTIDIIKSHLIVDIWSNEVAQNNLRNAIHDYFFDVLRDEKGVDLPVEVLDDLELKIMDIARARFAA